MLIVSVPKALLPTFHSLLSHSHKPTRVLIFLLSSIKWAKRLWPTFSFHLSNSHPISLQLNSSIAIYRFPLIFPTLCIEPTFVKVLSHYSTKIVLVKAIQWPHIDHSTGQLSALIFPDQQHFMALVTLFFSTFFRPPEYHSLLVFLLPFLAISSQFLPKLMSSLIL